MLPMPTSSNSPATASEAKSGSVEAFRANWQNRQESLRYHFKRGAPENQIQYAFQNHWRVFQRILGSVRSGRALEVGAGRGSMSAFFADAGFEVHLLDTSARVLEIARENFSADGLCGSYVCGDALALPYPTAFFDIVLSIGLFEHFAAIEPPLKEQIRILRPGGCFLGYVVPERTLSVQTLAIPLNAFLSTGHKLREAMRRSSQRPRVEAKKQLFRNSFSAFHYLDILHSLGVKSSGSFGLFPVPLVSHSPNFPFSLMSPQFERGLVRLWKLVLTPHAGQTRDPWTCPENWGLAFLVWAKKGA